MRTPFQQTHGFSRDTVELLERAQITLRQSQALHDEMTLMLMQCRELRRRVGLPSKHIEDLLHAHDAQRVVRPPRGRS